MINDVFKDANQRILKHFPERQIYLRSGGEVKYYVLSTKVQITFVSVLAGMSLWCLYTMLNLFWGFNPLRTPSHTIKAESAKYERLLADERAKLLNAELMLNEQRQSFETMAKSFEEKHLAISQLVSSDPTATQPITPTLKYAPNRVLMAPALRDAAPRTARKTITPEAFAETGLSIDRSLNNLDQTQNKILASAEYKTLDRIETNRAIIRAANMQVDTVLEQGPFGKGGPFIPLDGEEVTLVSGEFGSRVSSIQARLAEAEALDRALASLPLGHPVQDESYKTSRYGMRQDPFTKRPTFHEGLDFGGRSLAPIVATADGVVSFVGRNGGYGRVVEIDHGHGFVTRYAHLKKTYVKRGQAVKKGDKIAGMGSTGRSTATHLHYEIHFEDRVYDPEKFLKAGLYVQ
ncbi:murein DD-endopeptidase MepM/ murein hydrolase activator NlpD [Litorimonas taeanensis]|uniref:Murein DD-endopeptidase MepM/ murein hydrolase activator NlpD n=1 Tax=Litorimonas taeanensis TaxID=568099 RepID=A0A420WK07_9PROT|nr:M23 family metallopeptidase [Litorimonas taeanensis]RKQ71266.1 murein DD-endopeptidase MepM/ murein hydrolase activator NlpD [Litorimonas taeanensis]